MCPGDFPLKPQVNGLFIATYRAKIGRLETKPDRIARNPAKILTIGKPPVT